MRVRRPLLPAFLCILFLLVGSSAPAQQQVTVSSPHTAVSDSFFEHTGTSWGAQGNNWFFQFGPPGNPNGAAPQFGGFDPSSGANLGFGFGGAGLNGGFLGNFAQGSRRSFTSVTPSVTVPNGGTGMIMDSSVSPFVMGFVPVVGGFPAMAAMPVQPVPPPSAYVPSGPASGHPGVVQALRNLEKKPPPSQPEVVGSQVPEREEGDLNLKRTASETPAASESSAGRPAMGVAEARRLRQAEIAQQDSEARQFLERGRHAQADGKLGLARTYYRIAARRASPGRRREVLDRLASLPAAADVPR